MPSHFLTVADFDALNALNVCMDALNVISTNVASPRHTLTIVGITFTDVMPTRCKQKDISIHDATPFRGS